MPAESLGTWSVHAEGVLIPATGVVITPNPTPPPAVLIDSTAAVGKASRITTTASKASATAALAEAQAYHDARGTVVAFRGLSCFVADVVADHRAAKDSSGGAALVTAEWTLLAPLDWNPGA